MTTTARHRRRGRSGAPRRAGWVFVVAAVAFTWTLAPSYAGFTDTTQNAGNSWGAATLQPPSALAVTQTCQTGQAAAALSWTATPSGYATGYRLTRVGGPTQTLDAATTTAADGPLTASTTYTWTLAAYAGTWTSTDVTASLTTTSCASGLAVPGSFSGSAAASGPDLTLTAPSTLQVGDLMIAQIVRDQSSGNLSGSWTTPAGWTKAIETGDPSSNQTYSAIWWRIATAADVPGTTTYTWSAPNGNLGTAAMLLYRGYTQIDATSGTWASSGTTLTAPSVTTTAPNDVLVAFYAVKDKTPTLTLPAAMTSEYNYLPSNSPDFLAGAADQTLGATGATGSRTATTTSGKTWTAQLVAIRP